MKSFLSPKCEHVFDLDPTQAWHASLARQLLRLRSIAGLCSVQTVTAVGAYLWQQPSVAAALAGVMVVSASFMLLLRKVCIQNIHCDQALHNLMHDLRDHASSILTCNDEQARVKLIAGFHRESAEWIAQLFRQMVGCDKVSCCIRMLDVDESDNKLKYITAARSKNMNVNRADKSEPLASDKGIAAALRAKQSSGTYIIRDIESAIHDGLWHSQANDALLDAKSWLVSPINGWVEGRKNMLGILFIASHKSGASSRLYPGLTFKLQAIADYLGTLYPLFYVSNKNGENIAGGSETVTTNSGTATKN